MEQLLEVRRLGRNPHSLHTPLKIEERRPTNKSIPLFQNISQNSVNGTVVPTTYPTVIIQELTYSRTFK